MAHSLLFLGPELEAEVRRVREHAEKPENWFRPERGDTPPGENPAFVIRSGTFRAVLSITEVTEGVFRHASVSTLRPGHLPDISSTYKLVHSLGFTGATVEPNTNAVTAPGPWGIEVDGGAVVFLQEYVPPPS